MFDEIEINPRIPERHPEISNKDIESAWRNKFVIIERSGVPLPDVILIALGSDGNNRLIEMVGAVKENGVVHIFHAMTPPSEKTYDELRIS